MDVIWHDAPRLQVISATIEVQHRLFDDISHLGPFQDATAPAGVENAIELTCPQRVILEAAHDLGRKAIPEPERYRLDNLTGVEVREIAAGVPTLRIAFTAFPREC